MEIRKVEKRLMNYRDTDAYDDFTHVIFDREAYLHTQQDISALKSKIRGQEQEFNRELLRIQTQANGKVQEMQEQLLKEQQDMEQLLETYREQTEHYKHLNKTLLRVATERANVKKGLLPKKERSGYLHLGMEQTQYHYKDANDRKSKVIKLACWKIRLQSPYSIMLDYPSISKLINEDMRVKFKQAFQFDEILENREIETINFTDLKEVWQSRTILFKSSFKANTAQGFWEVEFWVNHILPIPQDMLIQIPDLYC